MKGMAIPSIRIPGTPEAEVAPCNPHEVEITPPTPSRAIPRERLARENTDGPEDMSFAGLTQRTLCLSEDDLMEFDEVIFDQQVTEDGSTRFRDENVEIVKPFAMLDETTGKWAVFGLTYTNEEVLVGLEAIPSWDADELDVDFFVATEISNKYCTHQKNLASLKKCACQLYEKTSTRKFVLDKTYFDDLELIRQEIAVSMMSDEDVKDRYMSHNAVVLALTTLDKNISYTQNHAISLRRLYAIRELYGFDKDFGQRYTVLGEFSAQFGMNWLTDLYSMLTGTFVKAVTTLKDFILAIFEKASSIIGKFVDIFSTKISGFMNMVLKKLYKLVWDNFSPLEALKQGIADNGRRTAILIFSVVMICVLIDILGFVTMRLTMKFIDKLTTDNLFQDSTPTVDKIYAEFEKSDMVSQSPEEANPLVSLITVIGTLLAVCKTDLALVAKRARDIAALLSFGKTAAAFAGSILILAPLCVRDLVSILTQSKVHREKMLVEQWLSRAHAVFTVSKIARVIVSPKFESWLNELYASGRALRLRLTDPTSKTMMATGFNQILKLKTLIASFKNRNSVRRTPHSVHISAPAGLGKTTISRRLIKEVYGDPEVYNRNTSDEYWSGFTTQNFVLIDEFLAASPETNRRIAEEYLTLISPGVFKPNFPSVDDPAVGLKGTEVKPVGVLTLNNHKYTIISGIDKDALWRRRQFVVTMKPNENLPDIFVNNKVDFTSMSQEQVHRVDWVRFDVWAPTPVDSRPGTSVGRDNPPLIADLTFAELVAFWKDDYTLFQTVGDTIARAMGEDDSMEIDVDELLAEEMRSMYNIPSKPLSVKEAIKNLITEMTFPLFGAKAQGDDPRTRSNGGPNETTQTARKDSAQHTFRKKWKRWIKEYPSANPERQRTLQAQIIDGYKVDKLGATFYSDQAAQLFEGLNFEEDYETPDEIDEPDQRDIITDALHTNVDYGKPHRHKCTRCIRQWAHRHGREEINHPHVCSDCLGPEHLMSGELPGTGIFIDRSELIPEDIFDDDGVYELTEEELQIFRERLSRALLLNTYDYFVHDTHDFTDGMSAPKFIGRSFVGTMAVAVSHGIALYVLFRGIRALFRMMTGDTEEEDEIYVAQSFHRENHKPRMTKQSRRFAKLGQQAGVVNYVELEINGVNLLALPLTGKTMMTYEHGFASIQDQIDTVVTFSYKGVKEAHAYHSLQLVSDPDLDILFVTLPRATKMNSFPNIVSKFWTDLDVKSFESCGGVLETPERTHAARLKLIKNRNYASSTRKRKLDIALGYQAHTRKGDCGSVLIATTGTLTGRYMGLHVAGGEGVGGFFGMSTIVTREMIDEALEFKGVDIPDDVDFSFQCDEQFFGPNLREIVTIPINERVHLSRRSKLKPSVIAEHLPWTAVKQPPIMSRDDPRASGQDPVVNMLNDTLEVTQPEIDEKTLDIVAKDMLHFYRHSMRWPLQPRRLTMEEAIGGIPGLLASMKVNSSAGYPLVCFAVSRGKSDWFYHDHKGELIIEESFREMVNQFLILIENPRTCPKEIEGRFLTFLKDELTTAKKISEKRCRLIFGGDMIANTAFRMLYGSFIIAFQHAYRTTPSAIGLNQYSYDMDLMYQYLGEVGENFIAGDFKNFDKKMVKAFQLLGYEIIAELCPFIPDHVADKFVYHQTESPLQIFDKKLYLKSSHFSGCFFTTILNVLVHEIYIRYVFLKLCPELIFEDHMRMKILGDDHIYSVSDMAKDRITPLTISKELSKLGQTYTSDLKELELTHEHRRFDDVTFLGAHPVIFEGKYVGALRKETLHESVLWTRNNDNTIEQECRAAMEMMSAWSERDYNDFYNQINKALLICGYDPIILPSRERMLDVVANRTAASSCEFPWILIAQGNDGIDPKFGLTKLNERSTLKSTVLNVSNVKDDLAKKAMSETPIDLKFSTDSNVWRTDFIWNSSQPAGTAIFSVDVPFGLLDLGDKDNIQNMPFERATNWTGDVEMTLQINGQPFQQGLLAMYFMPLASFEAELANITTTNHVLMTPGESSTASLLVPYVYPRSVMNTYAGATESLGTVYVTPLSPLQSVAGEQLNISVFSRFPSSTFRIPKIQPSGIKNTRVMWSSAAGNHHYTRYNGKFLNTSRSRRSDDDVEYEAQGAGQSTTVNNSYNNVGGYMPIQDNPTSIGQSLDQTVEADIAADVSGMPLDNPPLCSGSIPIHQTFSGMSASHGVRPTNDMQLYPSALSREQMKIFNPVESKIATLLGKKCLLSKFTVSTADPIGTLLYSVSLNSRFGLLDGSGKPFNVALLNQFMFWKANLIFEVVAVKTKFHSTRLNAVVTYGSPISSEQLRTVAFSHMIDFSGENGKFDFELEWNAQTEVLRTYEGEGQVDPIQNYSLGNLSFYLTNGLVAPESVENSFEVLVFMRMNEAKVAVPRPYSPFTFNGYNQLLPSFTLMTILSGSTAEFGGTAIGAVRNFVSSKALFGFNPTVPSNGTYNASGTVNMRIVLVGGSTVNAVLTVTSVEIGPTTVAVIGTSGVSIGSVGVSGTAAFESITILGVLETVPNSVKFFAQGNDIPPSQEDGVQAQDETVEAVPTTHNDIPHRIEKPCALEIGRKFEFMVSDIHEIGRRYNRVKLVNNSSLDQFVLQSYVSESGSTVNYVNFSVQVQSYLRAFFAVWAGSVKYRIFSADDNIGNIGFVPYLNTEGKICVPVIDAMRGNTFTFDGAVYTSDTSVSAPMAREKLYPISSKQFIDVSAPFQTHFNFCYNSKTQDDIPISSGTMALSYANTPPEIYTAFGDDLRLGIYRPPMVTRLDLSGYDNGVAGFYMPVSAHGKRHFVDQPTPGLIIPPKPSTSVNDTQGVQNR